MHLGNNGSVFRIFLMITEFLGFTLLFQHHRNSNEQAASGLQKVLFITSALHINITRFYFCLFQTTLISGWAPSVQQMQNFVSMYSMS